MKKGTKLWLLALALACVLSLAFAVTAFATDSTTTDGTTTDGTTTDETTSDDTTTTEVVFEAIPEENAGKIFHLFNADTGAYMASSNSLYCEDTSGEEKHGHTTGDDIVATTDSSYYINDVMRSIRKKEGNYLIKMNKLDAPYTFACTVYALTQNINSNVTIDLNGNTFIFNTAFYMQTRNANYVPHLTFTNGTIVNNNSETGLIVAAPKNTTQTSKFSFENITFQLGEKQSPYWILSSTAAGTEEKQANTYITLKDCTFDMSTVTSATTAFLMGNSEGAYIQDHVTLIGCDILGSTEHLTLCTVRDSDCTFTLEKGEDGNYITNTRPTTSDIPVLSLVLEEKKMIFSQALAIDENDNTTYALAEAPELTVTPYGTLPELYTYNPTHYPIVLFNQETHAFIWGGSQWGGEGSSGGVLQQVQYQGKNGINTVIYLQADASTSIFWNHGNTIGEHLIDLNGKTLNAADTVFQAVAKTKSTSYTTVPTVTFTVKNGTIALNSKTLIYIGSNAYQNAGEMVANYIFENVNITNIGSTACLATDGNLGNFTTTTNITFRDCTFTLAAARTKSLCFLGNYKTGTTTEKDSSGTVLYTHPTSTEKFAVNVRFEGGTITTPTAAIPSIFTNCFNDASKTVHENKTIVFAEGTNGYTSIKTASSTTFSDLEARPTADGSSLYFVNAGTVGSSQTLYILDAIAEHEYGYLPQSYLDDPETHKIIVFNTALGFATATFQKFGDETNATNGTVGGALEYCKSNGSAEKPMVMLVQVDIDGSTTYNNTGSWAGTHTIDLNGHSVSLAGTFLYLQAKSVSELNITVKNGTIVVNDQKVLIAASSTGTNLSYEIAGKQTTAIFENVTFTNIQDKGYLVYDNNTGNYAVDNFYEFRNCKVEVTADCTTSVIRLGLGAADATKGSALIDIDVKFLGGEITYASTPANHFYSNAKNLTNHTFAFGQYEGEYTKFTLNEGASLKESSFVAENGDTVYLRQIGTGEGTVQYQLTPYGFVSAFLNLTNDLNLVYRAFLPAGFTNPSVTFTVGDSTMTVTTYTNDDNGLYCFKLPNITPARMGELVSATLTATANGEQVSVLHDTLSVKNYAEALKAEYAADTALCTLVDALLVYGATAQQYLGQDASEFVTEIGTLDAIAEDENTLTLSGDAHELGGISHFAMTLNGAFSLRVGITVTDSTGLTLVATKGTESKTYHLENYTPDENGMISIRYDGVLANELDEDVTFTLLRGEEVIGKVLTANANSYLYRANAQTTDTNLATLARALYAYGIAAATYKTPNA